MDFRIIIADEDGNFDALTLGQFAMLNADDRDLVNAVRNIGIGETLAVGGGAAPLYKITRISAR